MNRQVLLIVLVLLLVVTAFVGFRSLTSSSAPTAQEITRQVTDDLAQAGPEQAPDSSVDRTGAKEAVIEFVLAVAHPDQETVTPDGRTAALALLAPDLVAKAKGDPASVLPVPRPDRFTASEPGAQGGLTVVTVEFAYESGPRTVAFGLLQRDGDWKIQTVQESTAGRR